MYRKIMTSQAIEQLWDWGPTQGTIGCVTGAASSGKTSFLLQAAVTMALAEHKDVKDLLGLNPNKAVRVFYVSTSLPEHIALNRLKNIFETMGVSEAHSDTIKKNFRMGFCRGNEIVANEKFMEYVLSESGALGEKPVLIIIDDYDYVENKVEHRISLNEMLIRARNKTTILFSSNLNTYRADWINHFNYVDHATLFDRSKVSCVVQEDKHTNYKHCRKIFLRNNDGVLVLSNVPMQLT